MNYGYPSRGGYDRDGGRGGGGYGSDRGFGGGSVSGEKSDIYVDQANVGRIIGRGGAKIRQLQDESNCYIKIYSDQAENGKVKVTLTGDADNRNNAEGMIRELDQPFEGEEGRREGGGGGGRFGGSRDGYGGGGGGGGSRNCYQCGKGGHIARDCTESRY